MADFIRAVTAHWFWWIGLVLTLEPVFQRLLPDPVQIWMRGIMSKVRLAPKWFAYAGAIVLLIALYEAWNDEHRNTQTVIIEKAAVSGKLVDCSVEAAREKSRADTLDVQNRSQQQTINAGQQTLSAEQQTVNNQQSTLNKAVGSCVTALSANNANLPPRVELINAEPLAPITKIAQRATLFILFTDKTITPVRAIFFCEHDVAGINAWPAGASGVMGGAGARVALNAFNMNIESPAIGPRSPLLITVYHNEADLGRCTYKPM